MAKGIRIVTTVVTKTMQWWENIATVSIDEGCGMEPGVFHTASLSSNVIRVDDGTELELPASMSIRGIEEGLRVRTTDLPHPFRTAMVYRRYGGPIPVLTERSEEDLG